MSAAQLDQQQTNSSGGGISFTNVTWVGQTFVPAISGGLSRLDVSLFCFVCGATDPRNPDIVVEVRTTSLGLPTDTVLATTTLSGFSSGTASFLTATFPRPPILSAGTAYAFTIHGADARATGTYAASFSTTPQAYPNGDRVSSANGGRTWAVVRTGATLRDLTFRTFMKLTQRIEFAPLADRVIGEPEFTVAATATSGLPVSFTASGACAVSGTTVRLTSVGTCAVTASQEGDDTYLRADPVTRTFAITYAPDGLCLGSPGHQVLPPLNADGSTVVKQRATIPVKFRVCDFNGVSVGTPDVVASFARRRIGDDSLAADDNTSPPSTTPFTAFRWDPVDQQWIFNLSTKELTAGADYSYRIRLADGSSIAFTFALR